jgi:nucleoside-diphosphate-sugar epimerase
VKRTLVTGATGFVGANLTRRLLRDGHEVHLLLRPGHAPWRVKAIRDDVHMHIAELGDRAGLRRLVSLVKPDWIFHLAVYGAYPAETDCRTMVDTNILGTINLVEAAVSVGFEAFVNTGSSSEYGPKDHAPSETEWLDPNSDYAVTKASATLFCRQTARARGVSIPTLRLYSAYGPYEQPTRLIPTLVVKALDGALPSLVDPSVARDFTYISDVCDAYVLAASRGGTDAGAVFNIGSGQQTTIRQVVDLVRRKFGLADEPRWGSMPRRAWDTATWVADNENARRELGWVPSIGLDSGLDLMSEWLQADRAVLEEYRRAVAGMS